jgi:hypothetical protein
MAAYKLAMEWKLRRRMRCHVRGHRERPMGIVGYFTPVDSG